MTDSFSRFAKPRLSYVNVTIQDPEYASQTIQVGCNIEDVGIGEYEYWGRKGIDVCWRAVAVSAVGLDKTEIDVDDLPSRLREKAERTALNEAFT
jgi:hypothetical protein